MARRKSYSADTSEWKRMKKNLTRNKASVSIGWFEGQNYGSSNGHMPMAQVAKWVEEGHINGGMFKGTYTPPRPAIRTRFIPTLAASDDFLQMAIPLIDSVARGKMSWKTLHGKIAPKLVNLFQFTLQSYSTPANSPWTVKMKGFNDPWRESGTLISSVRFKLDEFKRVRGSYKA